MKAGGKFLSIAALVVAMLMAAAAPAGAARIDRGFGENGVLHLPEEPSGMAFDSIVRVVAGPKGSIFLLKVSGVCAGGRCPGGVSVVKLGPSGRPDSAFGQDGTAIVFPDVEEPAVSLAVDRRGRPVIARLGEGRASLVRLTSDGSLDAAFGVNGVSEIGCGCGSPVLASIQTDAQDRIYVFRGPAAPVFSETNIVVSRVRADGQPDLGFGRQGTATFVHWLGTLEGKDAHFMVSDGGDAIEARAECCEGVSRLTLARVSPAGSFDRRFARLSKRSIHSSPLGRATRTVALVLARRAGRFDVLGSTRSGGYLARFLPSGLLDRRFGHDGVKQLAGHVVLAARDAAGGVYIVGQSQAADDRFRGFLFRLGPSGNPDDRFGLAGSVSLGSFDIPSRLLVQDGKLPLLFDPGTRECRSGCGSLPTLTRFTAGEEG